MAADGLSIARKLSRILVVTTCPSKDAGLIKTGSSALSSPHTLPCANHVRGEPTLQILYKSGSTRNTLEANICAHARPRSGVMIITVWRILTYWDLNSRPSFVTHHYLRCTSALVRLLNSALVRLLNISPLASLHISIISPSMISGSFSDFPCGSGLMYTSTHYSPTVINFISQLFKFTIFITTNLTFTCETLL